MKKLLLLLLVLLFITISLQAKISIYPKLNLAITEDMDKHIIRAQFAPQPDFMAEFITSFKYFNLIHQCKLSFIAWPFFVRNYESYITNKSLTFEMKTEYEFLFQVPADAKVSFLGGTGWFFKARWDRYSLGEKFWRSNVSINPLPFILLGIQLHIKRMTINLKHYIGLFNFSELWSIKDELIVHPSGNGIVSNGLLLHHRIYVDLQIMINKKISLFWAYENFINYYMNHTFDPWSAKIQNIVSTGIKYEIKH